MNYAINIQHFVSKNLCTTARKRSIKHTLIHIYAGLVFVRLGKTDYVVRPQQSLWIPFDCLSSLTIVPGTELTQIEFSMRLKDAFPSNAGYINLSPLASEILKRLDTCHADEPVYPSLLGILRDEAAHLRPTLSDKSQTESISDWAPDRPLKDRALHQALLAREIKKRQQSGQSQTQIIANLFDGDNQTFEQIQRDYLDFGS